MQLNAKYVWKYQNSSQKTHSKEYISYIIGYRIHQFGHHLASLHIHFQYMNNYIDIDDQLNGFEPVPVVCRGYLPYIGKLDKRAT